MKKSTKNILEEILAAVMFIAIISISLGFMTGFKSFGMTIILATIVVFLWALTLILIGIIGEKLGKRR